MGAVAVAAGLLLPRLLSGEPPAPPLSARDQGRPDSDLRYTPPSLPEVPSAQAMFARLAVGTIVVLGLCVVTLLYGKRWLGVLNPPGPAGGELRLVETLQLGNRCCLHLVQLTSRQVLIGADASGIKTVVPLPEPFENCLTPPPDQAAPEAA
jgi:hypothetical protein